MSEINSDAPLYDTRESRKEHIKKLEALLKLREDRKRFREVYRIYKAGIKENLLQNVQALDKAQTEIKEKQKEEFEGDDALKAYEDLGLFSHREFSVPKTWLLTKTIKKDKKKVDFFLNEKPVIVDPFKKILVYKNIEYPLNDPKMVDLLKGEREFSKYTREELGIYQKLMKAVKAAPSSARQKNLNHALAGTPPSQFVSPDKIEINESISSDTGDVQPTSVTSDTSTASDADIKIKDSDPYEEDSLEDLANEDQQLHANLVQFKYWFDKNYHEQINKTDPPEKRYQFAFDKTQLLDYHKGFLEDDQKEAVFKKFKELYPPGIYNPEKKGKGFFFLSDDPDELFERLKVLIAAKEEGHNNVFNEKHAILKHLLEKHFITKEQYKQLSHIKKKIS